MSPATVHSFVQAALLAIVKKWAAATNSGVAGAEWRVRILPEGSNERRPHTPDVAYFAHRQFESISRSSPTDVQYPPFAPAIAFEVISESDEPADIKAKRENYLGSGSLRVVEVYISRKLLAWSSPAKFVTVTSRETWTDDAFPGLSIDVDALFEEYDQFVSRLRE
jgi:Uma2 family endonuclease